MKDSSASELARRFPILFRREWRARGLYNHIGSVDPVALCAEYAELRASAPRRSFSGKAFFVRHSGRVPAHGRSNRDEEHCAIALVNLRRRWPRPDGGWFRLLDYQVPLKARQSDARIGKIDLLGVTDRGRLLIVELKVPGRSGGRSDAPPAALMEGLRYAAIVEAELEAIAGEAERRFGAKVAGTPPIVQLLAPRAWWSSWLSLVPAGNWALALSHLSAAVETCTGIAVECMALEDVSIVYSPDGQVPRFERFPALYPVRLNEAPSIGNALSLIPSSAEATDRYLDVVRRTAWSWADQHHRGQLDGGRREGRGPVLRGDMAARNVLVPPDGSGAAEVRALIPPAKRHRQFASLRSSQALAQSVFGALSIFNRLKLLQTVRAECGRPAFFTDHRGWTMSLEHEIDTLNEPRPTSIDVLLSSAGSRIAVECKFTEAEFGTCSRPRLQRDHPSYSSQRCDGSYRAQAGRTERCALTAIAIDYWANLPRLFAWPAERDHVPCPFGAVYQLARNALAGVVTADGHIEPDMGHVLVVYDARNPAFQAGGEADMQWEAAVAACLVPGLLRRIGWQRLLACLGTARDLAWLAGALEEKYGLVPD